MDNHEHTKTLALQSAELTERTPFCPEDEAIAEYFDGALPVPEIHTLERHLADCRYCLARIGMLNRQQADSRSAIVTGDILASAKSLVKTAPARRAKKAPAWAVAAVLVLGVLFVTVEQSPSEPERQQLRNIERPENTLEVFMPGSESVVTTGSLIRWTELPAGTHYTIHILSDEGDVLWTEHLPGNEWVLQNTLGLDPDGDFFFRVGAELPGGTTITSKHQAFRVTKRQ